MIKNKAAFARITYRTELGNADSEQIPLGLLVKFSSETESADYIILLSKERLADDQRVKLGYMAQILLKNPSEYLQTVIDQVVKKKEGDFFQNLASELAWSVFMTPSVSVLIPNDAIAELSSILEKNLTEPMKKGKHNLKGKHIKNTQKHYIYQQEMKTIPTNSTSIPIDFFHTYTPPEFELDLKNDNTPKAWMTENMLNRVHCH
ncbi:hypothetical protein GOB93_07760 [Acetobacter musti]|uniref:Uncharacterized protein n=1 Tax=Acetobacter musti TaxID=864732 RepID=A0ABX0JNC9_9PROT|nr:hypothetical protein [Acetobacter musti]NHN84539.1 hypothetical protein [Acetobacter musti]